MANEKRTNDEKIADLKALLSQELPRTTEELKSHLSALLACQTAILEVRIAAQTKLYAERNRLRMPKDKDYTDWDRKIMLDSATNDMQAEYESLVGLERTLETRINIIQTILC